MNFALALTPLSGEEARVDCQLVEGGQNGNAEGGKEGRARTLRAGLDGDKVFQFELAVAETEVQLVDSRLKSGEEAGVGSETDAKGGRAEECPLSLAGSVFVRLASRVLSVQQRKPVPDSLVGLALADGRELQASSCATVCGVRVLRVDASAAGAIARQQLERRGGAQGATVS